MDQNPQYDRYLPTDSIDFGAITNIMHHSILPYYYFDQQGNLQTTGDIPDPSSNGVGNETWGNTSVDILNAAHTHGVKVLLVIGGGGWTV